MTVANEGPQLRAVGLAAPDHDRFPFDVPAVRNLGRVELESAVTFLVGENGSGKSTLLEALAIAVGLPAVGSDRTANDKTLSAQRDLARYVRLEWRGRRHRGFFLRAEDFFGFSARLRRQKREHAAELSRIDREMSDASEYARGLVRGPHLASIGAIESSYGAELDAQSHGESFLALFQARLVPGGLFLLDEPEAALSPQSQLAFLAMVKDTVDSGGQFIIATHSPILMAAPGAGILSFDMDPPSFVPFDELEHVNLMRDFLANPERYLRHLWS